MKKNKNPFKMWMPYIVGIILAIISLYYLILPLAIVSFSIGFLIGWGIQSLLNLLLKWNKKVARKIIGGVSGFFIGNLLLLGLIVLVIWECGGSGGDCGMAVLFFPILSPVFSVLGITLGLLIVSKKWINALLSFTSFLIILITLFATHFFELSIFNLKGYAWLYIYYILSISMIVGLALIKIGKKKK